MKKQPVYGGEYYKEAAKLLRRKNPDYVAVEEQLRDGAYERDLYCISMLYDRFFDLDNDAFEDVYEMLRFLEFGAEHGFWLSLYQNADFFEKLQMSIYKGRTYFAMFNKPIELLHGAVKNFTKVPAKVSTLSKADVKKKCFLVAIKG